MTVTAKNCFEKSVLDVRSSGTYGWRVTGRPSEALLDTASDTGTSRGDCCGIGISSHFTHMWKFRNFVFATEVTIFSDHNRLVYLRECAPKSAKLTRWALGLQEFMHADSNIFHTSVVQQRKWHLNLFSRFCGAYRCAEHRHGDTDHGTCYVSSNRPHLCHA